MKKEKLRESIPLLLTHPAAGPVLTVAQAAEILELPTPTVWGWVIRGNLRKLELGCQTYLAVEELLAFTPPARGRRPKNTNLLGGFEL